MQQPDVAKAKARIDELHQTLNGALKQLNIINDKIKALNAGAGVFNGRRAELRDKLDTVANQIAVLEKERVETLEKYTAANHHSGKGPAVAHIGTVEEVDARIRKLERDMMGKRLSASQENKLIHQINQLKQDRIRIGEAAKAEAQRAANARAAAVPLKARLDAIKAEIAECLKKKKDLEDSLSALIRHRKEETKPLRELADEKEEVQRLVLETRSIINREKDKLDKEMKAYEVEQSKLRKKKQEEKAIRMKREELESRKAKLEEQLESMEGEAFSLEYVRHQRLLGYLNNLSLKLTPTENGQATEVVETSSPAAPPEGMTLILPKSERTEEGVLDKKKRKKKASKPTPASQPIIHDIPTLADFQRVGCAPPLTLGDVPEVCKVLEAKLNVFKEKQNQAASALQAKKQAYMLELKTLETEIQQLSPCTVADEGEL